MTASPGTDEIEKRARALLDSRIEAVRALAATRADVTSAREALERAETADGRAYAAAVKAGWTEAELKTVGFDAPTRRAPGRPRGSRAKTPAADNAPPAQDGPPEGAEAPTTS